MQNKAQYPTTTAHFLRSFHTTITSTPSFTIALSVGSAMLGRSAKNTPSMKAKMKCSNCGEEISNINMSWGRKYLWFMIPIMLIGFLPLLRITFFKGDINKDLSISEVQTRSVNTSLEITGLITNSGSRDWTGITVEAEFFDQSGKFLDEASTYLRSDVSGKSKEHFKITISSPPASAINGQSKPKVKIAGGRTSPF